MMAPRSRLCGLSLDRPRIMGIVNVTPDSFSDGGRHAGTQAAIAHGLAMAAAGADIIDVGGESTRPGSEPVALAEELARVMPVIDGLRAASDVRISIDTRKAEVMRRAALAGADILNDVSALTYDPEAMAAAAESGLPVVLMHAQGDPKTMQDEPHYDDVLLDVFDYLERRVAACEAAGIPRMRLIVDPGIGFGKTLAHNLALLSGLALLHGLGTPVLLGVSRKRFIGSLSGVAEAERRVAGSLGGALAGVAQGAHIVRVHDVAATREALTVWEAALHGAAPSEIAL
jgi:dihydropteroate synthase